MINLNFCSEQYGQLLADQKNQYCGTLLMLDLMRTAHKIKAEQLNSQEVWGAVSKQLYALLSGLPERQCCEVILGCLQTLSIFQAEQMDDDRALIEVQKRLESTATLSDLNRWASGDSALILAPTGVLSAKRSHLHQCGE